MHPPKFLVLAMLVPVSSLHAQVPAFSEAAPSTADQVPEPSALLLLIGAAAWILLRRKL